VPFALASLTFYSVGFLASVTYIVTVAPRYVGISERFRASYDGLWGAYDCDSWWFCPVELLYGFAVNSIPIIWTVGFHQLICSEILIVFYIVLLTEHKPWRFQVNHSCDFWNRMGSCAVILFLFFEDDSPTKVVIIIFVMPFVCAMCKLALYIWSRTAVRTRTARERVAFAQRFDDVSRIVGSMEVMTLRKYAINLLDNDRLVLDHALDIIQCTLLGLQQESFFRRRCENVPFEVATAGCLEGEVLARSLGKPQDHRSLLRSLLADLKQATSTVQSGGNDLDTLNSQNKAVASFIKWLRTDITCGNITQEQFVSSVLRYLAGGSSLTKEELGSVFDYVDLDMSGGMSVDELTVQLNGLPDIVFPL